MTLIDAAKQALEALEDAANILTSPMFGDAAAALRTAIEQADHSEQSLDMVGATGKKHLQVEQEPLGYWNAVQGWVELPEEEQKPTAWVYPEALEAFRQGKPWTAYGLSGEGYSGSDGIKRIPLYTTPPAAQRQPLTDERIAEIYQRSAGYGGDNFQSFARAIEAAHGIAKQISEE